MVRNEKRDKFKLGSIGPRGKAFLLIFCLVATGALLGWILSSQMVDDANDFLARAKARQPWADIQLLSGTNVILPTLGVIVVCTSICLMIGLIGVQIMLFAKTQSKYVLSLLVFLVPLLVKSVFLVGALGGLFISAGLPENPAHTTLNFSGFGLGNILVICAVFESAAMGALLYLSME
jgi:hypothetical protein